MHKITHLVIGESNNKVRKDVWVELRLGYKRLAEKRVAQAGGGLMDGFL